MKTSQKAMLIGLVAVIAIMIAMAAGIRSIVTDFTEGGRATESTFEPLDLALSDDLVDFDRLLLRGSWQISIVQGDVWDVDVSVPDDVEPYLNVGVNDGTLVLAVERSSKPWWFGGPGQGRSNRAEVTLPRLSGLRIEGAADVDLGPIAGESLALNVSGAGNIEATGGRFENLDLTIAGAANVSLDRMTVTNADVDLSGATNVELRLGGGALTGEIAGLGHLAYTGAVSSETVERSGFASIERR